MATLNKVMLIGNLTRDPELKYIPSGAAVASFSVAVNEVYKTQTGEKKEKVSYIRIVAWRRLAEVCGEYLSKGSPVFIEGRFQSRDWVTQDGQKRNTVEIIADNVQFLSRGDKQGAPGQGRQAAPGQDRQAAPAGIPEDIETIDLNSEVELPPVSGNGSVKDNAGANEEVPF